MQKRCSESDRIEVLMGAGAVADAPCILSSAGIGSCVVVTLYDIDHRIGGLAHIMLPSCEAVRAPQSPYHCVDTAIDALLAELQKRGSEMPYIVSKMTGGAQMFSFNSGTSIGEQNIESARQILKKRRVPLVLEDTGGHHGRSVEFHLDSGRLVVEVTGREIGGMAGMVCDPR